MSPPERSSDGPAPDAVVVITTAPSAEVAERLASTLVEAGLAACVNVVGGVRSIYRWKGKVHTDPELLLVVKARASRRDEVVAAIRTHHPYECPEAIVLPIIGGSPAYLSWLQEVTT